MKKILLILISLVLSNNFVFAADDLYSGEVAVSTQSEADRQEAIPEALIRVLQKLSGKREMPLSLVLDDALTNAEGMLRSFRYRNVDRVGPDGTQKTELRLVASFLQPEVDELVQEIGLPRWQQQRPAVQIWAILDDGRSRELKPLEYEYAWDAMEDVAHLRGLPISWPELDEEEVQLVDTGLVWGGFTDYLIERGAPDDGVAIVAARRDGPQWTLRWSLTSGDRNWTWSNADQELMFALVDGVHQMADQISTLNAIQASEQGQWTVDVSVGNLTDSDDYIRCLGYLQAISLVTDVAVLGAEPGRVNFRVQLNAAPRFLTEQFNRGSVLVSARSANEFEYEFLQ
jgi:hypothetical protein